MELKPGYKQTEVGVIPEDWEVTTIAGAGQVLGGRQRSPHAIGEPCRYLRVANVFDGYLDTKDVLEMPFTAKEKERFLLKDGDILLNEGQSLELVGRSAIYRGDPPDCCYQNTLVRFRTNQVTSPEFAHILFQWYQATGVFASIASQTTSIAHLGTGRFAKLPFPQPRLSEQRTIATTLGDVDALIASLDRLTAKKRDLKQAAMQQLLTGQTRLPGFSGEWEVKPLREGISLLSGHHVLAQHCNIEGRGVPYLTGPADFPDSVIRHTKYTEYPTTLCREDDILVTVKGSGAGSIVMADGGYCISRQLMAIRVKEWDAKFLYYALLREVPQIGAASTGLIPGLSRVDLLKKVISFPQPKEQSAIAEVLTDLDAEITALENRRDKTRLLKQGMMQELLTGRTRLV